MATDFIMPRVPTASSRDAFYPPPQPQHMPPAVVAAAPNFSSAQAQVQAQARAATAANFASQYNPQISPLSTSGSATPNSPKSTYHTRQVRPLYVPAVLRPTEHPSREGVAAKKVVEGGASGASSPGSGGPSGDDGEGVEADGDDDDSSSSRRGVRSSGSFISLPGLGVFGRLSRRSTNDSGKCLDGSWNWSQFSEVKGLPSREHWKPDHESDICDEPTCKRHFNYFTRRHHCRRCGMIFCDMHSSHEVPLDEKAQYNPRGTPSRACQYCFRDFKAWRSRKNSQDLSAAATAAGTGAGAGVPPASAGRANNLRKASTAPTSPVMTLPGRVGAPGTPTAPRVPDVAQSVPGHWNWSTF